MLINGGQKIVEALVAAHGELRNIAKSKVNPHFKNRYAPLEDALDDIRPILAKHKMVIVQATAVEDGMTVLHTRLMHTSGEWIGGVYPVAPIAGPTPQQLGSAVSYARRYALLALLSISGDDDDDGNQ